jgi:hypothetical protein
MEKTFKMAAAAEEPLYGVVNPLGRSTATPIPFAPSLKDFNGKTIGFVWSIFTHGDALADIFTALLRERFDDMQFVKLPSGKSGKWGDYPHQDFPDVVKESGADAVIALVGG